MVKTLSQLRNEKNETLTQREVAGTLDVAVSTIAMYETGSRTPSLQMAMKLADYYGVKVEEIFFGKPAHDMRALDNLGGPTHDDQRKASNS